MSEPHRGGTAPPAGPHAPAFPRVVVRAAYPRRPAPPPPADPAGESYRLHLVSELVARARQPYGAVQAYVHALLEQGVAFEWICDHVMPEVAERLGCQWEDDTASFVDVTIGIGQLEQLVTRWHSAAEDGPAGGPRPRALVGPFPGEQHTLGVMLVADCLTRDGWDVVLTPRESDEATLYEELSAEWYDVVALSVTTERLGVRVPRVVRGVRRAARNPRIGVLLGGGLFRQLPDLAGQSGADGVAVDAQGAIVLARSMAPVGAPDGLLRRVHC